jgi:hypothetical protein
MVATLSILNAPAHQGPLQPALLPSVIILIDEISPNHFTGAEVSGCYRIAEAVQDE